MSTLDDEFTRIAALTPNWDKFGGQRISTDAVKRARAICDELTHYGATNLVVLPVNSGGVEVEFIARGVTVTTMIETDGTIIEISIESFGDINRAARRVYKTLLEHTKFGAKPDAKNI